MKKMLIERIKEYKLLVGRGIFILIFFSVFNNNSKNELSK